MAKRTPPKSNNPFSALKGFRVSTPTAAPQSPPQVSKSVQQSSPAIEEEPVDFAAAMAQIGVRRSAGAQQLPPEPASELPTEIPAAAPVSPDEEDLFRRAVAEMQPLFRDEFPEEPAAAMQPRLTKLVRKGEIEPGAILDLHGVTRETLRDRLRWFLEDCSYQGVRLGLIVTGRGKSTGSEPVLRGEVERYLRHDAAAWVAEWDRAPGRLGGDGALLVLLKGKKT